MLRSTGQTKTLWTSADVAERWSIGEIRSGLVQLWRRPGDGSSQCRWVLAAWTLALRAVTYCGMAEVVLLSLPSTLSLGSCILFVVTMRFGS